MIRTGSVSDFNELPVDGIDELGPCRGIRLGVLEQALKHVNGNSLEDGCSQVFGVVQGLRILVVKDHAIAFGKAFFCLAVHDQIARNQSFTPGIRLLKKPQQNGS